ncbi:MAG: hypothetical protein ACOYMB_02775 [Patescibacteria group bacterium]
MNSFFIKAANAYSFEADSGIKNIGGKLGYSTGSTTNLNTSISNGISFALSFVGVLFLLLAIYAGFRWMYSQGNDAEVKKAKDILINCVIGLIIVALAYAISAFLFSSFFQDFVK